jgi:hypothetical protein
MSAPLPKGDGDLNCYNLSRSSVTTPRLYFVNGIRVLPRDHAVTAAYLSVLVERPVWGVYNATAGVRLGSVVDLGQSALDYTQNAFARLGSGRNQNRPPRVGEADVPAFLEGLERRYLVWNKATLGLFRELVENRHRMKYVIAHSQGNLITSNALFVLEDTLGPAALRNVRVYSLASPSPAWPLGLRVTHGGGGRQDNAFMNDLVALLRPHNLAAKFGVERFQNAGDFRNMDGFSLRDPMAPHDTTRIIETLNFLKSIRGDLGLSREFTPQFLREAAATAAAEFPEASR